MEATTTSRRARRVALRRIALHRIVRGRHVQHCELCILHTAVRGVKRTRADRLAYVLVLSELGHSRSIVDVKAP
ncbi:hypothetical protein G5I_00650 [Acromyrmex echinatior]|uniref:Uncharacterized protein n=1 Tax=Acromyrmex echinatior TaxID=103372 RepID=F4W5F3_ACREC|nr:hypothetical protein G5I_00650 [Acromyrmex echinatior]